MATTDPLPPSWDRLVRMASQARPPVVDLTSEVRELLRRSSPPEGNLAADFSIIFRAFWFRPIVGGAMSLGVGAAWLGLSSYREMSLLWESFGVWLGGMA